MSKFNTKKEAEKLGIKPYCEKCNKTFSCMYDYFSHMSVIHNIIYNDNILNQLRLKKCENSTCKKYISINSHLCRSCRQLGENNPIHNANKEKLKESCRRATKKLWENEEYRNKVIANSSKPRNEKFKKEQSIRIKKWFDENPEQKKIRSKKMRDGWKNGTYFSHGNYKGNRSKAELEIYNYLKSHLCGINRNAVNDDNMWYLPDIRFKNIVIEYFGDYWHANPNKYKSNDIVHHNLTAKEIWEHDKKRIDKLEETFAKVIIIWESDYKNRINDKEFFNNLIQEINSYEEYQSI